MPANTTDSLSNTMIYNAVPVEVKFNNMGPLKSSWGDAKMNLIKFGMFMVLLGAYSSLLSYYDYEPFPTDAGSNLEDIDLAKGFSRGQLINNALTAGKFPLLFVINNYPCKIFNKLSLFLRWMLSSLSTVFDHIWIWHNNPHELGRRAATSHDAESYL